MRASLGWLGLSVLVIACEEPRGLLVLDVASDLEPGVEVDELVIVVLRDGAPLAPPSHQPVGPASDLVEGLRVAELHDVPAGPLRVEASARSGAVPIVTRTVTMEYDGRAEARTILLTRNCRDVVCPPASDGAPETTCEDGLCVDTRCVGEDRSACPSEACPDVCPDAGECGRGVCRFGVCLVDRDPSACASGVCTGEGACAPELADAGPHHDAGPCRIEVCNGADDDCDGTVDEGFATDADPLQCGMECRVCPDVANGQPRCADGACGALCDPGYADCDAAAGCEARLGDPATCGSCTRVCSGATPLCRDGACASACGGGETECGGSCVDTTSSPVHCGGCDASCSLAHASATCEGSTCRVASCDAGYADCNGVDADGCERSTLTLSDCGACGVPCALPNALASCTTGTCRLVGCAGDAQDCDGSAGNGCECDPANAIGQCSGTSCAIGSCDTLYVDCDSVASNGCEIHASGAWDCEACASYPGCPGPNVEAYACDGFSGCFVACEAGWGDCTAGAGCETATTSDEAHCGGCDRACAANQTCASSACECDSGFGDCTAGPGCESALETSLDHCGACGASCASQLPTRFPGARADRCLDGECKCGIEDACGLVSANPTHTLCCLVSGGTMACREGLDRNTLHCGGCGAECGDGETCGVGAVPSGATAGRCCCGGDCGAVGGGAFCSEGRVCTAGVCG